MGKRLQEIKINIPAKIFKEGNSWIAYSKKYDISGYGKTKERAVKMFKFVVLDILKYTKPNKHKNN